MKMGYEDFLIGGTGFLGKYLCPVLLGEGG